MPAVKRSTPSVPPRRARAAATQARIVKAAYDLFTTRGYASTTMAEIAKSAGVAVQTVYFTFHTKSALLSRVYDYAVMGAGEARVPEQQPWYRAMVAEPELTAALRHLVTGAGEITRRVTPLYVVVRAAAESDAETARVMAFHENWRAQGYRQMLEILRTKAPLRADLSPERATHLLLVYVGQDIYHALVDSYGWAPEEWIDWTVIALDEQLFSGPARSRRRA